MGCTRKEAAEEARAAAERAAEEARAAAEEAGRATDVANKIVKWTTAEERAAADKPVKYAAEERAAAEEARAAAEEAPDEDVRSNRLWNEAELAKDKAANMRRVGPTGTWKGQSNKHNAPSSAKARRDKAEGWKDAAKAWANAAAF